MPGQPRKKKTPKSKRLYQPYSLQLAIEAVTEKKNVTEVSKSNFWSSPTNNFRLWHNQGTMKPGAKVFNQQVEAQMVKAASDAAQMGLGLSRYQFG